MDKHLISNFQFLDYKVDYIKFELNNSYRSEKQLKMDLKLETVIGITEDSTSGKVTLKTDIFQKAKEKNYPFSLEVSLTGFFEVTEKISETQFKEFLELNGTATMFPFLRSVISDITRISNIEPLILPLINIHSLVQQRNPLNATENQ